MAPRKKGTTRTPKWIKSWIFEEAIEKRAKPSELLAVQLRGLLVDGKYITKEGSPDKDTIVNYIQEARRKAPEERPWTLGISHTCGIPPEANADLLKIWKQSVLLGDPLTIREAQWAARLRNVRPLHQLLLIADIYAIRERVCSALRIDIETKDLDAQLVFADHQEHDWGYHAGVYTGVFAELRPIRDKEQEIERKNAERDYAGDFLIAAARNQSDEFRDHLLSSRVFGLASEELTEVYVFWVRRLMRGPGWGDLTDPNRHEIWSQLLSEVTEAFEHLERLRSEERAAKDEGDSLDRSRRTTKYKKYWHPSIELLRKVGYTSDDCHSHFSKESVSVLEGFEMAGDSQFG